MIDRGQTLFMSSARVLRRMLAALVEFIIAWRRCHRDRRLLTCLNERELRDLGLDRSTVEIDSAVEFWRRR